MLFYQFSKIPDCLLSFEEIEELILKRFQEYCSPANLQHDTVECNYQWLAHLLMSIIAIDFPHFKDIFINGETKIFAKKLKKFSLTEIRAELAGALQYLNSLPQNQDYRKIKLKHLNQLELVKNIIETMLRKSCHVFKKSHSSDCRKLKMTLPFTFLLKLVSEREVELSRGRASLSCGKWDSILESVFLYFLEVELSLIEKNEGLKAAIYESEDDRLRQIISRFTSSFREGVNKGSPILAENVDEDSRYFPPCMANLHQVLRLTHRLSYESRYQYALFLKDIGLSVDENILFWKDEFSKPHDGGTCIHDWDEKQKRYEYQIQHIYGLIGASGIKTSHSCDKFVGNLRNKMNGGCPFQHMDPEELKKAIPDSIMALPDVEDIFKYKANGLPQKACAVYLRCQQKLALRHCWDFSSGDKIRKVIYVVSPLQYYNVAKKLYS